MFSAYSNQHRKSWRQLNFPHTFQGKEGVLTHKWSQTLNPISCFQTLTSVLPNPWEWKHFIRNIVGSPVLKPVCINSKIYQIFTRIISFMCGFCSAAEKNFKAHQKNITDFSVPLTEKGLVDIFDYKTWNTQEIFVL